MLSELDQNRLAKAIQKRFPLVSDPCAQLATDLDLDADDVFAQLQTWIQDEKLREVSAVLEGSVLGWDSALVAGTVPEERLEAVAAVVSAHPTVTHNYERNHDFNLWFTIAVPPRMDLERTLALLAEEAQADGFVPMRRTQTFKIGVNFDLKTRKSQTDAAPAAQAEAAPVGPEAWPFLRALQTPLPLDSRRPFAQLAEAAGIGEQELLAFAKRHMGGCIRRYVGTFRHRKLGVKGNGMAVWNIPDQRHPELGVQLASAPEVTHCYAREAVEGFPFTTYSMIHGPDRESVLEVAARLSREIGIDDYRVLFSTREFKKTRLRYFLPELDAWWSARTEECAV